MFTRRRWVFLRMAVLCAGIGLMVAGGISYRLPRIYESTAVLEIPQSPRHNILMEGLIENLLSRNVLARSIERLGWSTTGGLEHEEALARLHPMLTVDPNGKGNEITLRVRHSDPKQSCDIAWAVIRSYGESRTEAERRDTERRLAELKTAMEKQEKVIAEAREKLVEAIRNTKPEMLQSAPEQAEEPKPPMTRPTTRRSRAGPSGADPAASAGQPGDPPRGPGDPEIAGLAAGSHHSDNRRAGRPRGLAIAGLGRAAAHAQ
jgi:hypothetical protein